MENRIIIQTLTPKQQTVAKALSAQTGLDLLSAEMLVRRGITTKKETYAYFHPSVKDLHDPFLMKGMDRAIERIDNAISGKENILIYGDYDVDGTTAVALVFSFLKNFYSNLDYYIPDRYTEGYGVSFQGIDYAADKHCTLIIALDCGIKSVDKVAYAKEKGIDFIVCDHHNPGEDLPEAVAVLDAKREDNTYPYRELSGCGVGFKLAQAYLLKHNLSLSSLNPLLPLTAMSIASDIVPLTGENRILAYWGLKQINKQPPLGVKALMDVASISPGDLNISDLVYKIGPRINACGRIKSGREAVRLLITDNADEARCLSETVNQHNEERRDLDSKITQEALEQLAADPQNDNLFSTVVCGKQWHKGVIGIVASRLIETYYRPTIVLTENDGIVSGSARSVGGFDLYAAIDACSDCLLTFGGHTYAAGLSMKAENYLGFKQRFEQYVATHILPEQQQPTLLVETELQFAQVTRSFFMCLQAMEPFGPDNERPLFLTRQVHDYHAGTRAVGEGGKHLRLELQDPSMGSLKGIAFGKGEMAEPLRKGAKADICYELQPNTFNGQTTIQMMVQDIRINN